jgi:hypothetical protein
MTATATATATASQPERPVRRGWLRRHIPTVTPSLWLCSVTGSPVAEAQARR